MLKIKEFDPTRRSPLPPVIKKSSPPGHHREEHKERRDEENEPAGRKQCKQGCKDRLSNHNPIWFLLRAVLSAALVVQAVD